LTGIWVGRHPCGDLGLVGLEPLFFGFEEGDGAGDDLSRVAIVAEIDFALDALFGGGIEGEVDGGSIAPRVRLG
jgi:hypothetical protein